MVSEKRSVEEVKEGMSSKLAESVEKLSESKVGVVVVKRSIDDRLCLRSRTGGLETIRPSRRAVDRGKEAADQLGMYFMVHQSGCSDRISLN